jgi:hypothetical protein
MNKRSFIASSTFSLSCSVLVSNRRFPHVLLFCFRFLMCLGGERLRKIYVYVFLVDKEEECVGENGAKVGGGLRG